MLALEASACASTGVHNVDHAQGPARNGVVGFSVFFVSLPERASPVPVLCEGFIFSFYCGRVCGSAAPVPRA